MDGGCERPVGFGFSVAKPGAAPPSRRGGGPAEPEDPDAAKALATLRRIGSLFDGIDAASVKWGGGGADISPLTRDGVPGLSLDTVGEHYFDWHHTQADTIDKVSPPTCAGRPAAGGDGLRARRHAERLVPVTK